MNNRVLLFSGLALLLSCTAPKAPDRSAEYQSNLQKAEKASKNTSATNDGKQPLSSKGTIEAVHVIPVSSRIDGQVVSVRVALGQHVTKGQTLVSLDNTACLDRINSTKAEYEQAQYRYQAVLMGLGYKLNNLGAATKEHKDLASVNSGLNVAKAKYVEAQHELEYYTIKAPISGMVSDMKNVNFTNVTSGQPLFSIIDDTVLKVCFDVLERELSLYDVGSPLVVTTVAYPDEKHNAKVRAISPYVKSNGMVSIEATLPNHDHLKPGMTAAIHLTR